MSALDKVLKLSNPGAASKEDPVGDLVLELSSALDGLRLYLASSDSDDDGDDDSGGKDDTDGDSGHSSHGTYKALIKKGVKPAMAAKMCARSDKKVAASGLADSACVILSRLVDGDPVIEPEPTYLGRVVALAATAAPVGPPKMDAHQLHVAHVKHVAHVAHEHVEHLAHMAHLAHIGK